MTGAVGYQAMTEHQRWTQTDISALRDRLQLGEAVAEIAQGLDRAPHNVTTMMARLRLRVVATREPGPPR